MNLASSRLTSVSLRLEHSLDALERAIAGRNSVQKQIDQSWGRISVTMKALARRGDWADHSTFRKQYDRHTLLQKRLGKAQTACTNAREAFEAVRGEYDEARTDLACRALEMSAGINRQNRTQGAINRTLDHVLEQMKAATTPGDDKQSYQVRDGAYDYIPYDVPAFLTLLVRLDELLAEDTDYATAGGRYRPVSLVEVGCGPGRNLLIARESKLVSWSGVSGFDINPVQVALGQRAFGLTRELQVADALTFDYSACDVVFSFRPFSDITQQSALEAHIAGSMRTNAYLLAPLSYDLSLFRELEQMPGAPDIWKKTGY